MLRRLFLLSGLLLACIPPSSAQLPETVTKLLRASNIPEESLGVFAMRVGDGTIVISQGADKLLQPASTMKLVTTLVGLEKLGPIHRGRAELRAAAPLKDGTLEGDLYLRGLADPDLTWEAFYGMLRNAREKGLREIRGNLVVDRRYFNPPRLDIGVPPFDETPEFQYNMIPDALSLNSNLIALNLESDGTSLGVRMTPELDNVSLDLDMNLVDRACADWEDGWRTPTTRRDADGHLRIVLHGDFPRACAANTAVNVLDRADFADRLFRSLWRYLGGTFSGQVVEGVTPAGTHLMAEHRSRPLGDLVRAINKPSDNVMARILYLTLGAMSERGGKDDGGADAPTLARAESEVRFWFKTHHIDDTGLVLDNGSGLSRSERISPRQLAALLQAGYRSPWAPEFISSLPIVGLDGTMRRRPQPAFMADRARLKTGTLRNVVAIAGYVPTIDHQLCIVAAIINDDAAKYAVGRPILDALVEWIAQTGGTAHAAAR
jgi:D-alanyl-D-alanine carboxypeptidase/D-alanyl-D-alanine-endopeptidase (penicillin-binding protein 4)